MQSQHQDILLTAEQQDLLVEKIKSSVTKPTSIIARVLTPVLATIPPEEIKFEEIFHQLDDEHRENVKAFLENRIYHRHWVSFEAAKNSLTSTSWFGWAGAGMFAAFGVPVLWPVIGVSAAAMTADQIYHQWNVKQRAPVVMLAMDKAIESETAVPKPVVDLLGELPAQTASAKNADVSLKGVVGTLFNPPTPPNRSKELVISVPKPSGP